MQRVWSADELGKRWSLLPEDLTLLANLIIQQHGKDAKAHAVQRVQEMRAAGNICGEWAWMGVFDAVLTMEATRPAEGEQVH